MTRDQKVEYIKQHLPELTPAQQATVNTAIIWGSTEDFPQWVAEAKVRFSNQATAEEIGVVMSHMQGAGNNARRQVEVDHALKRKEDQVLAEAISHMKF